MWLPLDASHYARLSAIGGQDSAWLYFSSSPLLLPTGKVIGMVISSFVHEHAQNFNYVVKFQLLSALLTSAVTSLNDVANNQSSSSMTISAHLSTPQLSKQSRGALWLVGCEG